MPLLSQILSQCKISKDSPILHNTPLKRHVIFATDFSIKLKETKLKSCFRINILQFAAGSSSIFFSFYFFSAFGFQHFEKTPRSCTLSMSAMRFFYFCSQFTFLAWHCTLLHFVLSILCFGCRYSDIRLNSCFIWFDYGNVWF